MSRWFRFYDGVLDDPKVQLLPDALFKSWVNLMCLSSKMEGKPFDAAAVAFALRIPETKAQSTIDALLERGLLDDTAAGLLSHNWKARQYKSDLSNQRVKEHRERKRNVTDTVTLTSPETEQNRYSEPNGSDAVASPLARLWSDGLPALMALGVKEKQARPMIGRWLKDASDDASRLSSLIDRARKECAADPIAWITAALKAKPPARVSRMPTNGIV